MLFSFRKSISDTGISAKDRVFTLVFGLLNVVTSDEINAVKEPSVCSSVSVKAIVLLVEAATTYSNDISDFQTVLTVEEPPARAAADESKTLKWSPFICELRSHPRLDGESHLSKAISELKALDKVDLCSSIVITACVCTLPEPSEEIEQVTDESEVHIVV